MSIDHLIVVVFEWMSGTHVSVCVCVSVNVLCVYVYIYSVICLLGDNGRLQYLRFSLLKCMLM